MNPGDGELSTRLSGLVDVGVVQAESELEAEFPDRVVEPLRNGVGGEMEAEDGRQGEAPCGAAARVEALIENMGWQISDASPHRPALAESLAALSRLGTDYTAEDLIPYARLATSTADLDFAQFEGIEDRIALAERAVVLTVLFEPVVRLLRRLAQEDANHRRHDRRACGTGERSAE
ncbi:hypothetical protein [Streptomyces sp. NPDC093591]|uniref:hypothetical protein n=1 Tax=Streptomyces sp. NPDC093591 TaxID=3366044 RepID=UPI00381AC671